MELELKSQSLYDTIVLKEIEPKVEYYKLLIMYKDSIIYDVKLVGQVRVAELLSNKEHKLIMTQSRLSAILKILEAL